MDEKIIFEDFRDVDLDFVKNYLRVDYDDDDMLIKTVMKSAESFIISYLDMTIDELIGDQGKVPEPIIISYLAIISHWYDRREVQSHTNTEKELQYIFKGILGPYRQWN